MKIKGLFFAGIVMVFISCNQKGNIDESDIIKDNSEEIGVIFIEDIDSVKNAKVNYMGIGVIVVSNGYEYGDTITIHDEKKAVLQQISVTEEYRVLALNCIDKDSINYKVQFADNRMGFINKNSNKVSFETWEEHILNTFSLGFEYDTNPLKKEPYEKSENIIYNGDEFYHPVKIKGDWLQVRWGYKEDPKNFAWIKWKEKNKLLIELFYFA